MGSKMRVYVKFSPMFFVFISDLRPMDLNVLGYQSNLLKRCHPACGHETSSHLSPVLPSRICFAMQVQHSYHSSTNDKILVTHVLMLSVTEKKRAQTLVFTRIELTTSALLIADVRGCLLEHSSDECQMYSSSSRCWKTSVRYQSGLDLSSCPCRAVCASEHAAAASRR